MLNKDEPIHLNHNLISNNDHLRPNSPPSTRPSSSATYHHYRPTSAFSNPISDPSGPEEPWAIPRSGRFWGHDDRQSNRGKTRGSNRGGRGLINKVGLRADWEEHHRKHDYHHHHHQRRSQTPAGVSDGGNSANGWITVQPKQKTFLNTSSNNGIGHHHDTGGGGEWRHDGWEEIERESDRRSIRGRIGFYRGSNWRGGGPNHHGSNWQSGLRRPTTKSSDVSSTTPSAPPPEPVASTKASVSVPEVKAEEDEAAVALVEVTSEKAGASESEPTTTLSTPAEPESESTPVEVAVVTEVTELEEVVEAKVEPVEEDEPASTNGIVVKLPTTIKIGTIPVYPPLARSHYGLRLDEPEAEVEIEEISSGPEPVTHLGSIGGAEVLREAMSSYAPLPPPPPPHTFVPHPSHPDFFQAPPPPPHLSHHHQQHPQQQQQQQQQHHQHHHDNNPIFFAPPPPSLDQQHFLPPPPPLAFYHHPHPPPLPPLQYFDPLTGQHMVYPHPPPQLFTPHHPPPPPMITPQQQQLPSTSSESLLTISTTPGLYAPPPKSNKIRITDPQSGLERDVFNEHINNNVKSFEHRGVTYFHHQQI
ncbi:hypothetical protein CROQUDRAFT_664626 [Cronartium quercuum f. sp. fusiforme G11]|uniref:Btz domain-containing protein n=1 Tax=Cronartium quercuum f. sp. fusiforme G11 TaxID=708437 RepID=A0A9P6NBR8_9BASI|nr:hypothetical protein CROQUDRAFT_664626 [Cronartium quercuum f. sp. fusiforme G11]